MPNSETRNSKVLASFTAYCKSHPDERFWQALRNWARVGNFIFASRNGVQMDDTFYWEGRDGDQN